MPRSRYKVCDPDAPHFFTCTVLNWIPIFTRPETAGILLEAFTHRQQEHGWNLYGYVILENHCHFVAQAPNLDEQIARFKSCTARQIIDYLREHRVTRILNQLRALKKHHKDDREYQLWEEGSHPQILFSEEVLRQKLDYIHFNPVKRGYVDLPEHWRYSSARNYQGSEGLTPVLTTW
jgi:REP element-mobilizing transposase RayT